MISSMREPRKYPKTRLTTGSRRKDGLKGIYSSQRGNRMRLCLSEAEVGQLPADIVEERSLKASSTLCSAFFRTTGEACVVYDE